ncbi:hypothetical protein [Winogradskyella sp. UBA3174]|uniref:hypothetical protein n=2 Tax=Winogradskyella TaxID=286104 RepID=UPI0025CD58BD|nr:hypothetical protein [Winogradskyella sp. UBA3174]
MGKMFDAMNTYYDSHSDAIAYQIPKLSCSPERNSVVGKNHPEYHFIYYRPKHTTEMKDALAQVKAMFKTKGVKNGYDVYHSGFGSEESFNMVSICGGEELDIAQEGERK